MLCAIENLQSNFFIPEVKMVKTLSEICLSLVQNNLDKIHNVENLPTVYKELLLQRIIAHDLLSDLYMQCVSKLCSHSLKKLDFYKCDQVTDSFLKIFKTSGCRLESLSLNKCFNVTGNESTLLSL